MELEGILNNYVDLHIPRPGQLLQKYFWLIF